MGKGNIIVGLVVLVAIGALASCGESESESLTKKEFLRQGDTICAKFQQGREEVIEEFATRLQGKELSKTEKEEAVTKVLERYEEATADLGGLGPPEADQAKVERIVAEMEAATDRAHQKPVRVFNGSNFFTKANEEAKGYGLDQCGV